MTVEELLKRRYTKMTYEELTRLNGKLVGKGPHWVTQERWDVTHEAAKKLHYFFKETKQ